MFKNISWHIELSAKDIYMKCSVEVDFLSLLGQLHLPALAAKKTLFSSLESFNVFANFFATHIFGVSPTLA